MRLNRSLVLTTATCLCLWGIGSLAWSCALPRPDGMWVRVVNERALIVWDSANKTEHFIRGAVFDTNAKDFGLLVPTPTIPDLAAADPKVFDTLYNITAAKEVWKKQREAAQPRSLWSVLSELIYGIQPRSKSAEPIIGAVPPAVQVLKQQQVAGYDAVVLSAEKPELILDWLKENGYEANENLTEWLRWYTEHQWVITAFKIAASDEPQAGNRRANNQLVRLSFRTDQPFYPYREPQEPNNNKNNPGLSTKLERMLRVYYVSDQAGLGTLGSGKDAPHWTAQTEWRDAITTQQIPLLKDLKHAEHPLPEKLWLTEFLDPSSPRLGTDEVYFTAGHDAPIIHRPDIVHIQKERFYPLSGIFTRCALDLLPLVVVGLAIVGVWRWRSTTIKLQRKNIAK